MNEAGATAPRPSNARPPIPNVKSGASHAGASGFGGGGGAGSSLGFGGAALSFGGRRRPRHFIVLDDRRTTDDFVLHVDDELAILLGHISVSRCRKFVP